MGASFHLHVEGGPNAGQTFSVAEASATIGRRAGSAIALADRWVSAEHARLDVYDGRLVVSDLGSANGTRVNGRRIAGPTSLQTGDRLQVGFTTFLVEGPEQSLAGWRGQPTNAGPWSASASGGMAAPPAAPLAPSAAVTPVEPPRAARTERTLALVAGGLVLVLAVLLCSGAAVVALGRQGGPATATVTATGAGQATAATATARSVALATALAPTATLQPSPTAVPTAPRQPSATPARSPTAAADFVSPLDTGAYAPDFRAWPVGEEQDARSSVDAASGEYHLALRRGASGYVRYAGEEHSFADFVVEVDARRVAGADQGGYGLAFRYQPPGRAGTARPRFVFYVTPAGSFALYLVTANSGRQVLQPEQPSPAVKRGDAANHLAVTCRGGTIVLAINGQTVGAYSTALMTAGEVGLAVVNADENDSTEAAFSNLRVVPLR